MTPVNPTHTGRQLALLAFILLAAFILRVASLDHRPLHFDEGNSVYFAQFNLAQLLQASIDTHEADPPGYRLSLGLWITLAGPSPVALRLYSVFYGVLGVAVLVALLGALGLPFGARLLAASLLASAAFSIDYSQQAKGYAMGAAMALVSWWAWVRLMRNRPGVPARIATVYIVSTLLMLSTHYYTAALLPMQWLWWFGSRVLPIQRLRDFGRMHLHAALTGIGIQALTCAPIAVWTVLSIAGILSGATGLSGEARAATPFALLSNTFQEMSAGQFAPAPLAAAGALVFVLLAIAGAVRLWRGRYRPAFWFGVTLVIPLMGALLLQQRVTFFYPRFLLYALPCLCALIAGIGLKASARIAHNRFAPALTAGAIAALAALSAAGTLALARAPIDAATDFRPLFAQVRPLIQQGDAALGSFIWMKGMMISYAPETQNRLRWFDDYYTANNVDALMAPVAAGAGRIWSFNYQRNPDAHETLSVLWLKQHAAYADRFSSGALSALLFDGSPTGSAPARQVRFESGIRLSYTPVQQVLHRGDTIMVTLNWLTEQKISEHDAIFLHLVAPDGRIVAQNDSDAVNGMAPSFTWTPNQTIVDRRALLVRDDLGPGDYTLLVGLYRTDNGARLKTESGADSERIGTATAAR